MPTPTQLSDRVHNAQVAAVTKVQDLTVVAVGRLADFREHAPKAPERVTRFVEPLTGQLAIYRRDWESVAKSFKERLSAAAQNGSNGSSSPSVTRPTVVKTSTSTKASTSKKASPKG